MLRSAICPDPEGIETLGELRVRGPRGPRFALIQKGLRQVGATKVGATKVSAICPDPEGIETGEDHVVLTEFGVRDLP